MERRLTIKDIDREREGCLASIEPIDSSDKWWQIQALLLDLETNVGTNAILKVGAAVGADTLHLSQIPKLEKTLDKLAALAAQATCIVGHNIWRHDIPVIADLRQSHPICELPVIDTLLLSPLAFPENPYHHLVKDYKLVHDARNNPLADARLASDLLADEATAFVKLANTDPLLAQILRSLLVQGDSGQVGPLEAGVQMFFQRLPVAIDKLESEQIPAAIRAWLPQYACHSAALQVSADDLAIRDDCYAFAYCLSWLRVAGANSVMPSWVRRTYPLVPKLIRQWRDFDCGSPDCEYCTKTHNPDTQLQQYFGFDGFRPTPVNSKGGSLQRDIALAGMRDESMLAVLPTGGGKSLCFQLPALVRHARCGSLTIVISPLQALMKDQVDGLVRRTGSSAVAALYGLLTPPERGDVLTRVRYGDIALLYVSPEQLRNQSFKSAIASREIGCWVFDEAHCLSKWGHDFRPDYLYAGRFIREFAKATHSRLPPVACFTATAKQDVISEICNFFVKETNLVLRLFEGGVERDNLRFAVETVPTALKYARIHELLEERLHGSDGTGVVFMSTRASSETVAGFLREKGWVVEAFHAGLPVPEKKRIQEEFLAGDVRVICATNAFGMGIDKDNIRVVIHGDTPGSLENYHQEAGRAGRDREPADCVLLYDDDDCERQFRLGALSELSRHDVAQILRGLRRARNRQKSDQVILTAGELLRDNGISPSMEVDGYGVDTKVRAAVAWLERAGFVERNQNQTRVFQAKLLVRTVNEARDILATLDLSERRQSLWLAIISELMNADPSEGITADDIARLPEFAALNANPDSNDMRARVREPSVEYITKQVFNTLNAMSKAKLLKKDTVLSAFVRYKVTDHSEIRLNRVVGLEKAMIAVMREHAPDPEGWVPLDLRQINEHLHAAGHDDSHMDLLSGILKSIAMDGRGFAGSVGSIELKPTARGHYRIRLRRRWDDLEGLATKRQSVARIALETIYAQISKDVPPSASCLCEFNFEQIENALRQDTVLSTELTDMQAAIERALMFLHEQQVIILQQGLAIFRSAMTIDMLPDAKGTQYTKEHYLPLQDHYGERIFQVHVMSEYARHGASKIKAAMELVLAYFSLDRDTFIKRYFQGRDTELSRATTAQSYEQIVDVLGNQDQQRIVQASEDSNMLVLAGPGSGKSRTVVHRCAYLLRVLRVPAQSILVCCFNRSAAVELRQRLAALVGREGYAVAVHTYHGLAMRLLGLSYRNLCEIGDGADFDRVITDATALLKGDAHIGGVEPDELRERLLSGYRHILVDEYQDIDEPQYDLISAIAGRTQQDRDAQLSIMAVGDDDQNIYAFRGANVRFIHQFEEDYEARTHHLIHNYRSTRYIIEAANRLIAANRDRMKTDHQIQINTARELDPPGGNLGSKDRQTRGRVLLRRVVDAGAQAQATVARLVELRKLDPDASWSAMAVLSRTTRELADVRTECEQHEIPVTWLSGHNKMPAPHRFREVYHALESLSAYRNQILSQEQIVELLPTENSPWTAALSDSANEWFETTNASLPISDLIEHIYESLAERKRECRFGDGVNLRTIHTAKGAEFPHVVMTGSWRHARDETEDERRVFYVGMTRAVETLTIVTRTNTAFPFSDELNGPAVLSHQYTAPSTPMQELDYRSLSLADIYLDYAGTVLDTHAKHTALKMLKPGDLLSLRQHGSTLRLDAGTESVAQLSSSAIAELIPRLDDIIECRILGLYTRRREDVTEATFATRIKADHWYIPICELILRRHPIPPPS